jgi:hypothetical protein
VIRLFVALTLFIRLTVEFVPNAVLLSLPLGSWSTPGVTAPLAFATFNWLSGLEWLLAAFISGGFLVKAQVYERMPDPMPGRYLINAGLALLMVFVLGITSSLTMIPQGANAGGIFAMGMLSLLAAAPLTTLLQALLGIGVLRALFSLDSAPRDGRMTYGA